MKSLLAPIQLAVVLLAPALFAQQTVTVADYVPPKDTSVLTTTYVEWNALVPQSTAVGELRPIFDNPTTTLDKLDFHATTLNPGKESHPPHRHPWEEMLLIKDGQFDVNINGRSQRVGPGTLVFFASNDAHNAKNVGTTPATYYVINFVSDLSHDAAAKPAAERAVPGKLASGIYDPAKMTPKPTKAGHALELFESPTLTFQTLETHITTLNPGQISGPDTIDHNDELVVFQSGPVEIRVDGVAARLNAGSVLFWSPNVKRTLINIGTKPVTYEVFRVTTARSPRQ